MAWDLTVQSAGEELPEQTPGAWFGPQATFEKHPFFSARFWQCAQKIFESQIYKLLSAVI